MKRANRIKLAMHRGISRAFVLGPLVFLLVAGAGCPSLFESNTHRATRILQATMGRDGAVTVTAAGTVVNGYAALSADVAAGATSVTVENADTNFGALAQHDLVLIIQMQGATMDYTDTSAYGNVTTANLGGAGRYEFVGVEDVSGNQITLACGLKNAYTAAGKTQVIRVPQYTTLTVNIGASITARAWNGTTGGIVAVHARDTLTLEGGAEAGVAQGSIDVSALGFRGGAVDDVSAAQGTAVTIYRSGTNSQGAEKGEGIAGYQGDYDGTTRGGRYGRGAPANGGGGGNSHNAGGGGGANAASGATWTGAGVMTSCTAGSPGAWSLDSAYTGNPAGANTCSNSEGGGRGGYSFSYAAQDPTAVAPGDASWGGNRRRQVGGLGGRPVPNNPSGAQARLFMGGGGGAGDGDNTKSGRGGKGGGLVFVIAGQVTGTGRIVANGEAGASATSTTGVWNDAAGGGGGGGTIVVSAPSIGAISITANGGPGGDNTGGYDANEAEGPGGGGGGGYVAVTSGATATISAARGLAGTTDHAFLASFPQNGATAGNAGVSNGNAGSFLYCGSLVQTTISGPPNPSNSKTGVFTFTNTTSPVTYECQLDSGAWAACSGGVADAGDASHTTAELSDGPHTLSVRATGAYGNVETPVSYPWVIDTVAPSTTILTGPDAVSTNPVGVFTFGSNETPVTFECNLDNTTWTSCGVPCGVDGGTSASCGRYTTAALPVGSHTLSVRATDAAGNVDATPATYAWAVNATPLTTTIATYPPNPSNSATGGFTFTNTSSPVTYECKIDSGAWAACSGAASHTTGALADGSHTLSVRATYVGSNLDGGAGVDAGSTVENPPVTYTWVIDTVPPNTTIVTYPPNPSGIAIGAFTFGSNESPVTYECRLDGGAWAACIASYTTPALPNGSHTLDVRATDAAGNVDATPATYTWVIAAVAVDGGAGDVPPAIDGGSVTTVDAGIIDAPMGPDLVARLDVGQAVDLQVDLSLAEVPTVGPEPSPDTAPAAEPNRDAAPVNTDVAIVANADAAPVGNLKVLGGGFCAIAQSRPASPAGFLVLALAGLALLRQRRR